MKRANLTAMALFAALFIGCTPQGDNEAKEALSANSEGVYADAMLIQVKGRFPGLETLEEAADPRAWRPYFPTQYKYWETTAIMRETLYGGGGRRAAEDMNVEKIDYLEIYPFLKTNYAGFPFSKGYYRSRGHLYALTDVIDTERLPDWDQRPASCLSCKSSDVVVQIGRYGDEFYGKSFARVVGENTVSCLDCHDHSDASLKVQRDYVFEALALGTFRNIKPEGRADLVCAQCHVNYHFHEKTRKPVLPWSTGLTVEDQLEHYSSARRSDEWVHPITGALVAKIQHPEYELYHEGKIQNIHSSLGLGCNDCHMPGKEDAHGKKYTSHTWTSPLTHVETSCLDCHHDWTAEVAVSQAQMVQGKVYDKQNRIGSELAEFIITLGERIEGGGFPWVKLEKARSIHREAQFYWDFVWVENSNGFHNWEEAHRILDNAERLIQEGMALIRN